MKKKAINSSGINVCDSIVMSVKRKHVDLRRIEAVLIAVLGYASAIMSFVLMFDFKYEKKDLAVAAVIFSAIYIALSLMGKRAVWFVLTTLVAGVAVSFRMIDSIALGYKFVYNVIYRTSYHTEIDYYKFLSSNLESESVTIFFIFCAWVLAIVIYMFTIYHPHSIPPLIVTFPLLETGLYNGIEVSIFWGSLLIAYWLGLFAMTTIDMGEYSGGSGGFVRRDNMFFPKRQMRLKVTEKCSVIVITAIIIISSVTVGVMKVTNYKRSDEINQKRIDVRDAVNNFSVEDLADSVTELTAAFGFNFKVERHKLGNVERLKYKDTTDLVVSLDQKYYGAIYLKEYTGSVYGSNEWLPISDSTYRADVFKDFKKYSLYPQSFPNKFNKVIAPEKPEFTIWIESKLKGSRSFAPYGTDTVGVLTFNHDTDVSSKSSRKEFSYKFTKVEPEETAARLLKPSRSTYHVVDTWDEQWKSDILDYAADKDLVSFGDLIYLDSTLPQNTSVTYDQPDIVMAQLLDTEYEKFVYANYLQIPDTTAMNEIRDEFADILELGSTARTATEKLAVMSMLRNSVSGMVEYSLVPGKTPSNRDFVNYFLTENRKGYCVHYATTGVMLARMAGIPARYATGYVLVGDDFTSENQNEDGSYTVSVKDDRSHAWVELYLDGYGWVPYEFTAGYSEQTIDPEHTMPEEPTEPIETETTADDENGEDTSDDPDETTTEPAGTTEAVTEGTTQLTDSATTAAQSTIYGGFGNQKGTVKPFKIPKWVKYTFLTLLTIALIVLAVLARRQLVIKNRRKRFTEGTSSERIRYIYRYVEKLLNYRNYKRDDLGYTEFADRIEEILGGVYFPENSFAELMDAALRAAFSPTPPTDEEAEAQVKFADALAQKFYDRSGFFGRFYLKYISCKL